MKINNIYSNNYEIDLIKLIICVYKKKFSILFKLLYLLYYFIFIIFMKKNPLAWNWKR
jgi:hypothetical protein